MIILFLKLLFVHCLADYPMQGDFLSKAKNHKNPIANVPFYQALFAHSIIQAGFVYYITNNLILSVIEFLSHSLIDWLKCDNKINFNQDQILHISFKLFYSIVLFI